MSGGLSWAARHWLCLHGAHWPIRWSHAAIPMQWDPPEPPEPGFACDFCGHNLDPYHWIVLRPWWRAQQWWFERGEKLDG